MQIHLRERDGLSAPAVYSAGDHGPGAVDCRGGVYSINAFLKTGAVGTTGRFKWQSSNSSTGPSWVDVEEALEIPADGDREFFSLRVPVTDDWMRILLEVDTGGTIIVNSLMYQLEVVDTAVESAGVTYGGWQNQ